MDPLQHYQTAPAATAAAPWLDALRNKGRAALAKSGFPRPGDEDWKYTNPARLLAEVYEADAPGSLDALPSGALVGEVLLVLVDGCFRADLSRLTDLPDGVVLRPLSGEEDSAVLGERVGSVLGTGVGFDALNAAYLTDGALVEVAPKAVVDHPIHVVHVVTGGQRLTAARVAIRCGQSSQATVVEHWMGVAAGGLTTAITEIELGPNSSLAHVRVQDEAREGSHHVGTVVARQDRDSRLKSHVITLGAALSRVDVRVQLAGVGAEADLQGLYLLSGTQHADHHTHVDHAVPHTHSREHYKGILDDKSRGVFTGRVLVRKDAQQIDSAQANHNLVLSDAAVANTRPQLEIFADDVKCAHGATIGRIDPEAAFYLQARGLTGLEARRLLTFAFANEILTQVSDDVVRGVLEERARTWLEST